MRVNRPSLDIALARRCKSLRDLRGVVSADTLTKINRGDEVRPKTVGKIAYALEVDAADLLSTPGGEPK